MVTAAELFIRVKSIGLAEANKQLSRLRAEAAGAEAAARRTERGFNRFDRNTRLLSRNLGATNTALGSLTVGLLGLSAARRGIRTLADYGEQLAQLQGIAIRTTDTAAEQARQFRTLRQATIELGATTRFSASQIADAQVFLARTGFDTQQVLGALEGTLALAAGTGIDLAKAADLASNSVKQFGLDASETGRVADVLSLVTIRANTDITQLGEALKLSGAVANAAGLSIEEAGAVIGSLGDSGTQATVAGTQLRGIIAALSDPTEEAKDRFEVFADALGISADQFNLVTQSAQGAESPLFEVLGLLREAGAGIEDFFTIFGRRQATGGAILTDTIPRLIELSQELENANGTAARLAGNLENTLAGSFRRVAAAAEALVISIGDRGAESSLRAFAETLAQSLRILAGTRNALQDASDEARLFAKALQALAAIIVVVGVGAFANALIGLASNLGTVLVAVRTLNLALLANPFGAIAAAAAGLTVATSLLVDAFIEANDTFDNFSNQVDDLERRLGGLREVRGALDFAQEIGNSEAELSALTAQLQELERVGAQVFSADEFSRLTERIGDTSNLNQILSELGINQGATPQTVPISSVLPSDQISGINPNTPFPNPEFGGSDRSSGFFSEEQEAITAAIRDRISEVRQEIDVLRGVIPEGGVDKELFQGTQNAEQFLSSLERQTDLLQEVATNGELAGRILEERLKAVDALGDGVVEDLETYLKSVEEQIRQQAELEAAIDAAADAERERQESQRRQERALKGFEQTKQALQDEITLLGLVEGQREVERQVIEAVSAARQLDTRLTADQQQEIRDLANRLRELQQQQQAVRDIEVAEIGAGVGDSAIESLEREIELVNLSTQERERQINVDRLREQVLQQTANLSERQQQIALDQLDTQLDRVEALRQELAVQERLAQLGVGSVADIGQSVADQTVASLEKQVELLGLTNVQAQKRLTIEELRRQVIENTEGLGDGVRQRALDELALNEDRIGQLVEQLELTERLRTVGEQSGQAIADALFNIIQNGGEAEDILKALIIQLSQIAFQQAVAVPLAGALGAGFAGAAPAAGRQGLVFDAGVTALQRGGIGVDRGRSAGLASGIISNPTLVPQALIGEGSRAEGVFPLDRMGAGGFGLMANIGGRSTRLPIGRLGDGNLGVRANSPEQLGIRAFQTGGIMGEGFGTPVTTQSLRDDAQGGPAMQVRNITVNQRIDTPNADSFRRSERQNLRRARAATNGTF